MRDAADARSLEVRLRWLSVMVVMAFASALLAGTILHLAAPGGHASTSLLRVGLILLMSAPAVRIGIGVAERVRLRDWTFVLMIVVVILELSLVLWRAAART